jgi:hypothetical protein
VHCLYTLKQAVEIVRENDRSVSRKIKRGVLRIKKRRDMRAYSVLFNIAKAVKLWRLQ